MGGGDVARGDGVQDGSPSGESRALTGLRGIGATLVMLHHFFMHLALDLHMPMVAGLLRKGYLGVDLFFVLSGFVIAMVYGPWFAPGTPGRAWAVPTFLILRVARIWPLHATIVAALVVEALWLGHGYSRNMTVANFGMVQAWGLSAEINPPAWSISTEMLAYLLFPVSAPLLLGRRWGVWLGVGLTITALAACVALAPPVGMVRRGPLDIYFNYSTLPLLRCLAGFALGMAAWRVGQHAGARRAFTNAWAGPLALALMLGLMLGRVNDLLIYPLLPLIVLGMHYGRGPVWAGLAHGPVHRLGLLSYAVYLVHVALLYRFPLGWGPLWLELGAYLLLVAGLATLAHAAVERPGRALVRRALEAVLARMLPPGAAPPLQGRPPSPI